MAVVVSEEQGEVEKFRKGIWTSFPIAALIKEAIDLPETMRRKPQFRNMQRMALDDAFKEEEHPFRIAIVCAMWLTGFDVPCLSTLYLDKPLKAHTLMQAIARANRVNEGKNNGMIVDYCGILKNLRKALATFAGAGDDGRGGEGGETEPARPEEELLADLAEAIALVRTFLTERGASLDDIITKTGFGRNAAILAAKEAANENDETENASKFCAGRRFQSSRPALPWRASTPTGRITRRLMSFTGAWSGIASRRTFQTLSDSCTPSSTRPSRPGRIASLLKIRNPSTSAGSTLTG